MSRILCLSRGLFCTNCKYSVQNLTLSVPLFTSRAMSRKQLSTPRRPTLTFRNNRHAVLWIFGLGAGFIIALGLKYRDSERSVCEEQQTAESVSKYLSAIENSRDLLQRTKDEVGAPGMVIGVSVDGCEVWCEGLGYADLENRVACGPDTVMRIASISKPLTTAAVARLWENEMLDLDAPVQDYVPEFPHKQFEGEDVTITPRMLLSHLSGIRHYEKDGNKVREDKEKVKGPSQTTGKKAKVSAENELSGTEESGSKNKVVTAGRRKKEFEQKEYYLKESFENVIQALELFKDDPLIFKPGSTFLYSTHAFTLLSAVVERAAGQRFLDHMMQMFRELGMLHTVPDENEPLIYKRSRFYHVNKKGRIVNCPYVDNSYKWAGGGFLSTVNDLLVFGNALLYSYQIAGQKNTVKLLPGFLKPQTARSMWAPVNKTEASWDKDGRYAQGWLVVEKQQKYGQCRKRRHYVSHTGGAVGASSVLLVLPRESGLQKQKPSPPHGVVVTILTNLQSVGLNTTALKIALEFDKVKDE